MYMNVLSVCGLYVSKYTCVYYKIHVDNDDNVFKEKTLLKKNRSRLSLPLHSGGAA